MVESLIERIRGFEYMKQPIDRRCMIWDYRASHSLLTVQARLSEVEESKTTYIVFAETRYFEGPTHWTGTPLEIATSSEFESKLESVGLASRGLRNNAHMFYFVGPERRVTIIAHDVYESEEPPD